ncbi:DUF2231 domain-containing protein [Azospirillum sp. SYSU D00513]|uniref:DUF2231 domain-containing protein n=1 Tax=Azospirillum sp. SYSU D00513 TaxID=2812561 RepID=UPI001A97C3DC|nr:DUF2231 domain-containing protein [Azospirillum sp. SYSU D00513]
MGVKDMAETIRHGGSGVPEDEVQGATSAAAVGKHPIHPTIIPFPIAFLTATLATDVAYWRTGDPFWAQSSRWLLRAGLASGVVAGAVGAVDYAAIPRTRKHAVGPLHALGNVTVLAIAAANLMGRRRDPEEGVVPRGLALSAATTALLGLTAWAGGELIYRHRVGVVGEVDESTDGETGNDRVASPGGIVPVPAGDARALEYAGETAGEPVAR